MNGDEARPYTVHRLNALIKGTLETRLPPLWVIGEVSDWKQWSNGNIYFSLKDKRASVRCVMWSRDAQRLPAHPRVGMQIRVFGHVTVYEQRGDLQLQAHALEAEAAGGLWKIRFEKVRARLEAEGLLAPERKRGLPRFPIAVGVVTSAEGAAVHDIINVVKKRAPWVKLLLSSARVQGEGAAIDIAHAIKRLEDTEVDVIIVGRGGGSSEDLWAFNEEIVARAIAASSVPVVSAVGHETDITIADLIADVRAPTPSAAAERVVPDRDMMLREFHTVQQRMHNAARRRVMQARSYLESATRDMLRNLRMLTREREQRMRASAGKLEALSPLAALSRGYSVALAKDGHVLKRTAEFVPGSAFVLRVSDGAVDCRVND
ncbi:MAG TPA: exodeoxyribonuclease VII large subunit [Longimicrobiales bacterium]|nr:exodeoxyribonuclease VII large subunit [Longimicrobiales bacterium]